MQDLDINFQLVLNAATYDQLMGQLGRDCALLESLRVMDYSLLLGVHYLSWGADEWIAPQIKVGRTKSGSGHATHPDHARCGLHPRSRWVEQSQDQPLQYMLNAHVVGWIGSGLKDIEQWHGCWMFSC